MDLGRRGDSQRLIRHQRQRNPPPVGGPEQEVLDDLRRRVVIHPDVHHEAPQQIARECYRTPGLQAVRADGECCHVGTFLGMSLKV